MVLLAMTDRERVLQLYTQKKYVLQTSLGLQLSIQQTVISLYYI